MRRPFIASALTLAAPHDGHACPRSRPGARPAAADASARVQAATAAAAPVKPYTPVAVTPAGPFNDPSFEAFRKNLADIAERKDRAALAKLIVAQGFFWVQDKDLADKRKPGIDNLAKAIDLDAKDGSGWDVIANYAAEPTAAELPEHKGIVCAPADPTFDPRAFERAGPADTDGPERVGLSDQCRHRSARRAAAECGGDRQAGHVFRARAARQRIAG